MSGPGLVEQLQLDAMNGAVPITELLRKAKAVAVKLKRPELAEWVQREMSGYPDLREIPEYRKMHASVKFFNPVHGWCPVSNADHEFNYGGSMAEIVSLLAGEGDLRASVPAAYAKRICDNIGFNVDVQRHISRSSVAAIVESVRNIVHDWALKLEEAGIHGEGISFTPREAEKAQTVVVNIGSIGNATGIGSFGDNANITATQSIDVRQLAEQVEKLVSDAQRALPTSGLTKSVQTAATRQLDELKSAARESVPDADRLQRGLTSLRTIMEGAAGNLIASGVLAMIAKILSTPAF